MSESNHTVLSFGVPTLDVLLGKGKPIATSRNVAIVEADDGIFAEANETASICMVGPDGTGKSVLALHLASHYAARYLAKSKVATIDMPTRIIYVSTDLSFSKARAVWDNFGLDQPGKRWQTLTSYFNFLELKKKPSSDQFNLVRYRPLDDSDDEMNRPSEHEAKARKRSADDPSPLSVYMQIDDKEMWNQHVAFLDLAGFSAGDDWTFLDRMLTSLKKPRPNDPRHLLIIDAVEGLQFFGGDRDSYGELRDRRSVVAQFIRAATDKCHVVFVIEEPKDGERHPEQFVTDGVVRLRAEDVGNGYLRRTVEVEKSRGQTMVRGRHTLSIRNGHGSTTGFQVNPDDPQVKLNKQWLAYVILFHSLDYRYSEVLQQLMEGVIGIPGDNPDVLNFGLRYLDNMLRIPWPKPGSNAVTCRMSTTKGGLPAGSVTALIGPYGTHKGLLGRAFISQSFYSPSEENKCLLKEWAKPDWTDPVDQQPGLRICEQYEKAVESRTPAKRDSEYQKYQMAAIRWWDLKRPAKKRRILGGPTYPAVVVYFTTEDIDSIELAERCFQWLNKDCDEKEHSSEDDKLKRAFYESRIVCRRIEIHTTGSGVLFSTFTETLRHAIELHFGKDCPQSRDRQKQASQIRVVIDNWSNIETMYPEVRNDPLFLPALLFHLRRLGVTTLIVETRADAQRRPAVFEATGRLASLVDHAIYTWNVPFHGHRMVAISPLAAFSVDQRSVVRELKLTEKASELGYDTCYVDPHLEIYGELATAEPKIVPLRVCLINESEGGEKYIANLERQFIESFYAVPTLDKKIVSRTEPPISVNGLNRYSSLRETSYLHGTMIDYTIVIQVDEFWVSDEYRSYLNLYNYLIDEIRECTTNSRMTDLDDPFRVFRKSWSDTTYEKLRVEASTEAKKQEEEDHHYRRSGNRSRMDYFDAKSLRWGSDDKHLTKIFHDLKHADRELASHVNRVPYTWDFGFLLCARTHWFERKSDELRVPLFYYSPVALLKATAKSDPHKIRVGEVWNDLDINKLKNKPNPGKHEPEILRSWRFFLDACDVIASRCTKANGSRPTPFAIAKGFNENLSCALLEIWFSELYLRDHLNHSGKRLIRVQSSRFVSRMHLTSVLRILAEREPSSIPRPKNRNGRVIQSDPIDNKWNNWFNDLRTLEGRLQTYRSPSNKSGASDVHDELLEPMIALFKAFCLLHQVVVANGGVNHVGLEGGIQSHEEPAVAARHWYASACQANSDPSQADATHPCRMPGRFTTRGDWFLGILNGSRSVRLGERAIDILSSVRANAERLELGVGLPSRKLRDRVEDYTTISTALSCINKEGDRTRVSYADLLKLAGHVPDDNQPGFRWIWRSSLESYDRHSRVWQEWILRTLRMFEDEAAKQHTDRLNGYDMYDLASAELGWWAEGDTSTALADKWRNDKCNKSIVELREFQEFCGLLIELIHSLQYTIRAESLTMKN